MKFAKLNGFPYTIYMKLLIIVLGLSLIPLTSKAAKTNCTYLVDESSVKVLWTAYKTSDKTPVQGELKGYKFKTSPRGLKSMKALMSVSKVSGFINTEKSSESGNPARDQTLYQKFFSLIASSAKYEGMFNHIKGNDQKGEMELQLFFNQFRKPVPMKYSLSEQGNFEAVGEFNMNDFRLAQALASIHQACEELHKGKDGLSKTWPEVGIKITAKIKKDCKK